MIETKAFEWWCGDEECDCTERQIKRMERYPNGMPILNSVQYLYVGKRFSADMREEDPDEYAKDKVAWIDACVRFGVEPPEEK